LEGLHKLQHLDAKEFAHQFRDKSWKDAEADQFTRRKSSFHSRLMEKLEQDGIITPAAKVDFQISEKEMKVNGKKMSSELYAKYDRWIRDQTGIDHATYQFNFSRNPSDKE
jgi:hypothetical protein